MIAGITYVLLLYKSNARELNTLKLTKFYTHFSNTDIYTNIHTTMMLGEVIELRSPHTVFVKKNYRLTQ
jgi:hypothetical protein